MLLRASSRCASYIVRDHFLSLAQTWTQLARELEASQRFLKALGSRLARRGRPAARPRSRRRRAGHRAPSPLLSSRLPWATPSETVSTATFTSSSSRRAGPRRSPSPCRSPWPCRRRSARRRTQRQRLHLDPGLRGRLRRGDDLTSACRARSRPRRASAAADGRAGSAR